MIALPRLAAPTLDRPFLLAYLGAFTIVIIVFSLVVRYSVLTTLDAQTTSRLVTLARAGTAAIAFTRTGYVLNQGSFGGFSVRERTEGLQWFDPQKRLVASRGLVPLHPIAPILGRRRFSVAAGAIETDTIVLEDGQGVLRGYVRASESDASSRATQRALDLGLFTGSLIALVAAAAGGMLVSSSIVSQTEDHLRHLSEFITDASHELRSPLAALASTASVAEREAPDLPEMTRARLGTITDLTASMRRLVDDLLILARASQSIERELFIVQVRELLENIDRRFRPLAEAKSIDLRIGSPWPLRIYGNPAQVERVIANLVENAIRYTEPRGSVEISCTSDTTYLRIDIKDTGIGIAPEHQRRIFERFWRVDAARSGESGTGLGLAIAQALARRHGGVIAVTSKLRGGSTFALTLPLRPPSL
jgi:two-component system, OmpR family, manganese sensing sensor histidine kinase